jgi:hypothetical protein
MRWKREGCIEDYGQIDSLAYFVHLWMKYPKFGFSRTTDIASRWIRKGTITRDEGKLLGGHEFAVRPQMFIGAAANPFAGPNVAMRVSRLAKKVAAGVQFIQTQCI